MSSELDKMADDIDIEEHDVLDNPAIKNIFPDLTIIKREIQKYYEDGPETNQDKYTEFVESPTFCEPENNQEVVGSVYSKKNSETITEKKVFSYKENETEPSKFHSPVIPTETYQGRTCAGNTQINNSKTILFPKKSSEYISVERNLRRHKEIQRECKKYSSTLLANVTKKKIETNQVRNTVSKNFQINICETTIYPKKNPVHIFSESNVSCHKENHTVALPNENKTLFGNKIILGSKPSKALQNKENLSKKFKLCEVKVVLKDVYYDLDKSKKFCKKCFILFSKQNNFNLHIKKLHSENEIENTATETKGKTVKAVDNSEHKCKICEVIFSSSGNLNRHLRNVHYKQMFGRVNKASTSKKGIEIQPTVNTTESKACFHCKKLFPTQQELIEHLYDVLQASTFKCKKCSEKFSSQEQLQNHTCTSEESISLEQTKPASTIGEIALSTKTITKEGKSASKIYFYRCSICSYYFKLSETLLLHMRKMHGTANISEVKNACKKSLFESKCKHCSCQYTNYKKYNCHMHKCHKQEYRKRAVKESAPVKQYSDNSCSNSDDTPFIKMKDINASIKHTDADCNKIDATKECRNDVHDIPKCDKNKFLLKSILFKCSRCDIHFLSAKTAMLHVEHIEMLINWKCSVCQLIFKKEDEIGHENQHSYNSKFTIHDLSSSSDVLYKCPNCAIHFAEDNYFHHHEVCGLETANSMYCKICDILIDSDTVKNHKDRHQVENLKCTDFTVVEPDVIVSDNDKVQTSDRRQLKRKNNSEIADNPSNFELKRPKLDPDMLLLTYCDTCKCFINKKYRPSVHLESRCSHIVRYVCDFCGLILTNKSINTHRALHKKRKDLKLQDFQFDDLRSKQLIYPPVPEYPKCNICEIHFLNKNLAKYHSCSECEFIACPICEIKLSGPAYKLHMPFHSYSKLNTNSKTSAEAERFIPESVKVIHDTSAIPKVNENLDVSVSDLQLTSSKKEDCDLSYILFSCQKCHTTVNTYDKLIEHCQTHFIYDKEQTKKIICLMCNLVLEADYYDVHRKLHVDKKLKKTSFKVITCDISFYGRDYNTWIKHVFGNLTADQKSRILKKSIYKHETRVKMEVIQNGPWHLTLYKCNKCRNFVDPSILFKHTHNACYVLRRHPCSFCGIPFLSVNCRNKHEKIHKRPNIGLKSYRIVLFNKDTDKNLNELLSSEFQNQYTLHQCRHCNGIINIGEIRNHICNNKELQKCLDCGLLIRKLEYESHLFRHKECLNFNKKNLKVILVGEKRKDNTYNKLTSSFEGTVYDFTFYKCVNCQVCVRSYEDTLEHLCLTKQAKIKCVRCDQYFPLKPIRHHQKLHEIDSNIKRENLTIVLFNGSSSPSKPSATVDISVENETTHVTNHNPLEVDTDCIATDSILRKRITNGPEKVVKIYKCKDCGLHFLEETGLISHFEHCSLRTRASKQNCSKCNLLFTPNVLFKHLLAHHGDKRQTYTYDIINKTKNTCSTIYKCSRCNLHFVLEKDASQHFDLCKGVLDKGEECSTCKLRFNDSCWISHQESCYSTNKYNFIELKGEILGNACGAKNPDMDTEGKANESLNILLSSQPNEGEVQTQDNDQSENILKDVITSANVPHEKSIHENTNENDLSFDTDKVLNHLSKTTNNGASRCCGWFIY